MSPFKYLPRQRLLWIITGLMPLCMMPAAITHAASIRITWNANREADLHGYKVYYGTATGTYGLPLDVGNVTACEIPGLTAGAGYFISLTAYDTSNNESAKSVEIAGIAQSFTTITSTLPSSSSSTSSAPPITTTIPAVTTQPSSTSTTAAHLSTTTIVLNTTTIPFTSTQPSSSTSSTEPSTTTTTAGDETASCNEPLRLQPIEVAASSAERFFFPIANIIDGDPRTSWVTLFSLFNQEASIVLDLGSEKTITSLALYASRIFGIDVLPVTLALHISNDNATWHTINTVPEAKDLESADGNSWQLQGHSCRYMKLRIGGRKTLFLLQLAQIAELEIYGCDAGRHPLFSARGGSPAVTDGAMTAMPASSLTASSAEEPVTPSIPGKPNVSFQ